MDKRREPAVTLAADLLALLDDCLVRLDTDSGFGTGFFVTPRHVLSCAHVVTGAPEVRLWWNGERLPIHTVRTIPEQPGTGHFHDLPDLAVLTTDAGDDHPWVALGEEPRPRTRVTARGFSMDTPSAGVALDIRPLDIAGPVAEPGCLSVVGSPIPSGMSGGPVLDEGTSLVCGLVKASRGSDAALGGWVISVRALRGHLPELVAENAARPGPWQTALEQLQGPQDPDFYRRTLDELGARRPGHETPAELRERAFWNRASGQLAPALDLYRKLATSQADHDPTVLLDRFAVAELLNELGETAQSRVLLAELVPVLRATLPDHPDTTVAQAALDATDPPA
jgi:hypothetical protein